MKSKFKNIFKNDFFQCALIFIFILCINIFVIGTNRVCGISMYPTLNNAVDDDRIVVEKISTYSYNYKRGDVITFNPDCEPKELYVKRIIGLPGDVVEISNGRVFVNGSERKESYLSPYTPTRNDMKVKIPEGTVFVLGDNREHSVDSREIGSVPMKNIKGHAIYRFNISKFKGNRIK